MMTLDERKKSIKELGEMESKLIDMITETDNEQLMDAFLDWQTKRTMLNEDSVKFLESLIK